MVQHEEIFRLLREKERIKEEQLQIIRTEKQKNNLPLGYLLIRFGLLSAERWHDFVTREFGITTVKVSEMELDREVVTTLPEFVSRRYQTLALFKGGGTLICGMVDPLDDEILEELNKISKMKIEVRLIREEELRIGVEKYFSQPGLEIIQSIRKTDLAGKIVKPTSMKETSETSAQQVVENIVRQAIEAKATDIHFEIEETGLRLRLRINGLLYEFPPPPVELYSSIVSHIKVISNLDIAEKRVPQDGYVKIRLENREVDLRVSSYPTLFGEIVALRVLDKANIISGLEQLGFLPETLHRWRILLDEPYGMLLVTGPTGSGKTTTLYSSLNELDSLHRKIMTIEDPIEYHLKNVDQTQVNPKAGFTFATALRSILRQDPNCVMIGEIRDAETASIAFRAAQTGQLVFATLHTNTAPGAIIRLLDMGVESYLISSSLVGVLNQRLVRTICHNCREEYRPLDDEIQELDPALVGTSATFYRGRGCHLCKGTGFASRTGLHELMVMNEEVRRTVIQDPSIGGIRDAARKSGMFSLREDGARKVGEGVTTIGEVLSSTKKAEEAA